MFKILEILNNVSKPGKRQILPVRSHSFGYEISIMKQGDIKRLKTTEMNS